MKKLIILSALFTLAITSVFAQLTVSVNSSTICVGTCTTLNATVNGGTVPFTYTWSTVQNLASITVCPTTTTVYTVTATDNDGLTATASATVTVQPNPNITATGGTICLGSTINISANGVGSGTYLWNIGSGQTKMVTPNVSTTYTVTGTDANGCTNTASCIVIVNPLPAITSFSTTICQGSSAIICASGGSTYVWSHGLAGSCISVSPVTTTTYWVTGTDANGCWGTGMSIVTVGAICPNLYKAGVVYNDLNNNGVRDAGEPPLRNVIVKEDTASYCFSSNDSGSYMAYYGTGSYTLSIPYLKHCSVSPLSHTFSSATDSTNDFGLYYWEYNDLSIYASSANSRPGFNTYYYINYKNMGTDTANGKVRLVFDHKLNYISSSPTPSYISNDTLEWNYSDLLPYYSDNGAILYYWYSWNKCIGITFLLPSSAVLGDTLFSTATIYPVVNDSFPSDNIYNLKQRITGSYDPNDKQVSETSLTPEDVANEPPLTYTIRFQNTGTDTAFTVVIKDTLSNKLNIPTLETVASSHPYTFTIKGNGICEWKFNNILLPDSNVNEPKSHGFVKYRAKTKNNLLEGDSITNKAYIYFDYNQPVVTNTAKTLIMTKAGVCEKNKSNLNFSIFPNPFTTQTQITYSLNESANVKVEVFNIMGEKISTIVNSRQNAGNYKYTISGKDFGLSKGVYFIKLQVNDKIAYKKVVGI